MRAVIIVDSPKRSTYIRTENWQMINSNENWIVQKASDGKPRHLRTIKCQRRGASISNQVKMHACHLTLKHCINVFKIL
jgi:hypothetical protein